MLRTFRLIQQQDTFQIKPSFKLELNDDPGPILAAKMDLDLEFDDEDGLAPQPPLKLDNEHDALDYWNNSLEKVTEREP